MPQCDEKRLKRNICKLDDHAVLSKTKDLPTLRTTHIGNTLEYACQFWTNHLSKIPGNCDGGEDVEKAIEEFFRTGFLFWVEVLILTGNLEIGLHALHDIEQWYMAVSYIEILLSLCSCIFRQEHPANGQLIARDLSWTILTQSWTALQGCTMLLQCFAHLHPGSMSAILQSSHIGLG
jgi:hypothetical protein